MITINYNRDLAIAYAKKWHNKRNEHYYNFDKIGGDCTNFVSQCLYAGCRVMNYTPLLGWYYFSLNNRTPSWTGVNEFYNFLISNNSLGPFAIETNKELLEIGDIIELGNSTRHFYHTVIITDIQGENIFSSSHTADSYNRFLESYNYSYLRCIHILGARK